MSLKEPLGQPESQRLEFNGKDVLQDPFRISREVVAMLNAEGGAIWIGLREQDGIATAYEGLQDPEAEWRRLLDHLVDVIEPPPSGEITKEVFEDGGRRALRLRISPDARRRPYALVQRGGRHYLMRVDHRIRPMTREEILGPVGTEHARARSEGGKQELLRRRLEVLAEPGAFLWLGIRPDPPVATDLGDDRLEVLLLSPRETGNRRSGLTFHLPIPVPPPEGDELRFGRDDVQLTTIRRDGSLDLVLPLHRLHGPPGRERELFGTGLLEFVVSGVRLARALYRDRGIGRVLLDVALVGTEGWELPSYAPGVWGAVMEHEPPHSLPGGVYTRIEPLDVSWPELDENPDRVGFRLVRDVYRAFGLPEERMPREYDRASERLLLTD